ncbi:hypothetical protein ACSFA3_20810 [Variovorax sp. RHLX14]
MNSAVQNLCMVELGEDLVAEADFMQHRIRVRCTYVQHQWCWTYNVFLVEEGKATTRLSPDPSQLRTASRIGAANMGMTYAVNHLLGVKQPSLMLVIESPEEMARLAA